MELLLLEALIADFKAIEKDCDDERFNEFFPDFFLEKLQLLRQICEFYGKDSFQPVFDGIDAIDTDEYASFLPICINICEYLKNQLKPSPAMVIALPQSTEIDN